MFWVLSISIFWFRQAVRLSTEEAISNRRNSEDEILRAFQALDVDKKGYLEAHELQNFMTSYGEKFSNEEVHHLWKIIGFFMDATLEKNLCTNDAGEGNDGSCRRC